MFYLMCDLEPILKINNSFDNVSIIDETVPLPFYVEDKDDDEELIEKTKLFIKSRILKDGNKNSKHGVSIFDDYYIKNSKEEFDYKSVKNEELISSILYSSPITDTEIPYELFTKLYSFHQEKNNEKARSRFIKVAPMITSIGVIMPYDFSLKKKILNNPKICIDRRLYIEVPLDKLNEDTETINFYGKNFFNLEIFLNGMSSEEKVKWCDERGLCFESEQLKDHIILYEEDDDEIIECIKCF